MVEVEGTTVEVESVKTSLVDVAIDPEAVGPEIEDDCSSVRLSVVVDVTDCEAGIEASVLVGMGVAVESDDGEDIELDGKPVAPPLPPTAEEVGEEDEGRCERAGSAPGELYPVPPPPVDVESPAVEDRDGKAERERDDGDADVDGDGGMIEDAEGADEDVSCEPVCVVGVVSNEGTARFDEDPSSVEGVVKEATVPVCDDGIKAGDDGPRSVSVSATATATEESESLAVARFDARCGGTVMRSRSEGDEDESAGLEGTAAKEWGEEEVEGVEVVRDGESSRGSWMSMRSEYR